MGVPIADYKCEICGRPHVAYGLSCNESRLVKALGDELWGAASERPEARAGTYEAIAAIVRRERL